MERLKFYPFCGGKAYVCHDTVYLNTMLWRVECFDCGCMVYAYTKETEQDAITKWNTRHEPRTPSGAYTPARSERLKE